MAADRKKELARALAELEELKRKKRILDEREQHHIARKKPSAPAKPKKAAAKKAAPKRPPAREPKRADAKKPDAKKTDPKKAAAKKADDSKKTDPKRPARARKPRTPAAPKTAAAPKKAPAARRPARRTPKVQLPRPIPKKIPSPARRKTIEEDLEAEITSEEIVNFQIGKQNMEQLITNVCEILAKHTSGGMLQPDLIGEMGLSMRDGFRLAMKLEWLGLISREKVLDEGRWTYKLFLKRSPISTRSIIAAPCLTCQLEPKCTLEGEVSPLTCDLIRDWVLARPAPARRR